MIISGHFTELVFNQQKAKILERDYHAEFKDFGELFASEDFRPTNQIVGEFLCDDHKTIYVTSNLPKVYRTLQDMSNWKDYRCILLNAKRIHDDYGREYYYILDAMVFGD